jgi:lipopolysaccharide transport system permease protein
MPALTDPLNYAWKNRRAWWFTATARTRERFVRTTLGSFWLGFSNLISIAVLAIVYGTVFKVKDFNAYVVYLGVGLVIWNIIAASIQSAAGLFKSNSDNIKNTNIHPIFYSLEEWSFQVQTFAQSFGLVILALVPFQPSIVSHLLLFGVLPLINLLLFIYWFPLLISLLGAPYEDLFQLIPIVLQLLFLLSPILYKRDTLGPIGWSADFNPFYRILDSIRHALIHGQLRIGETFLILLINIIGLIIAVQLLERRKSTLPFVV